MKRKHPTGSCAIAGDRLGETVSRRSNSLHIPVQMAISRSCAARIGGALRIKLSSSILISPAAFSRALYDENAGIRNARSYKNITTTTTTLPVRNVLAFPT